MPLAAQSSASSSAFVDPPTIHITNNSIDGTKDAASEFSTAINNETVIVCGSENEMRISHTSAEYHGFPPPPPSLVAQSVQTEPINYNNINRSENSIDTAAVHNGNIDLAIRS